VDASKVEGLIRESMPEADVQVEGAGANYDITVISDVFADMRPVRKQQAVYAALREAIAAGSIHAVNIRTFTPAEWAARSA
jgi:acid stress-induced BolA-like protein IbaG/YrbA